VRCGEERRAVGKTGIGLLPDITTRSGEPQDRSPGPLRASAAPRQILSEVTSDSVGKGLTIRVYLSSAAQRRLERRKAETLQVRP
jgi:hypothetical protein